jgi:hypothetical protein
LTIEDLDAILALRKWEEQADGCTSLF